MTQLNTMLFRFPVMTSLLTVFVTLVTIIWSSAVVSDYTVLSETLSGSIARILVILFLLTLALKLRVTPQFFVNNTALMPNHRWAMALPMLIVAGLNLFFTQWQATEFQLQSLLEWLMAGIASGFFEEVLMRAVVFCLLWRAWQSRKNGLILAALAQASLFGVLHLLNSGDTPTVALIAQVSYAIFLGFGFAALVAYTRSIWPAIAIHAVINLFGSINRAFIPGYVEQPEAPWVYVVLCTAIFFLAAVPGWVCIRRASQHLS